MNGSLRYPHPDRLLSSQIHPALLLLSPLRAPTFPPRASFPRCLLRSPSRPSSPQEHPPQRPSSDTIDSHQALCWLSPPQYSILWGQEGRCGHGGTCECTPCRAPGPQTTLHAAPLAGKVCWVFTPHRGLPPPHVCGERSAERTEPHPGDADLRPWMPRPALNSRATHSLKLHLIRPSLVVQGLGRHPSAA